MSARHPFRLTAALRLETATPERHVADLIRLVLLTSPLERVHAPDFGAGLGVPALFAGRDPALLSVVGMRARGSLELALGDRIEVLGVGVDAAGESTLTAQVTYRLRPAGETSVLAVVLPGGAG